MIDNSLTELNRAKLAAYLRVLETGRAALEGSPDPDVISEMMHRLMMVDAVARAWVDRLPDEVEARGLYRDLEALVPPPPPTVEDLIDSLPPLKNNATDYLVESLDRLHVGQLSSECIPASVSFHAVLAFYDAAQRFREVLQDAVDNESTRLGTPLGVKRDPIDGHYLRRGNNTDDFELRLGRPKEPKE